MMHVKVARVTIERVILVILDSVGAGAAPDAKAYGDEGANTLGNIARHVGGLRLPNLERLGLGNVTAIDGLARITATQGAFGRLRKRSAGKDTISGHWELAGLEMRRPFATFPDGFPAELVEAFTRRTGRGVLGNAAMAQSAVLKELGEEHVASGRWILTTCEGSVFQVAAHEDVVPVDELYTACRLARRIVDPYRVSQVVARPFKGRRKDGYKFTPRRREFNMAPPRPTVLDTLSARGVPVVGVGRIDSIFTGRGLTERLPSQGNTDGMIKMIEAMVRLGAGLVVTHLDDFDSRYGHRRDPKGYARCLEEFDVQLAMLLSRARDGDLLLLTADHGTDPTRPGSGHSRELVPILAAGPTTTAGVDLGTRKSFADVGATIAEVFGVEPPEAGESFLKDIS